MKDLIVDYIPFEVSPQQINESLKENEKGRFINGESSYRRSSCGDD